MPNEDFDVFLAHNSQDKPQVRAVANCLRQHGVKPWLDEEQIPPGQSFQDEIQQAIQKVKSAAVFVGNQGLGRWQGMELKSLTSRCVERKIPVIPVLLPGVSDFPDDLIFLREFNAVRFSERIDDGNAISNLIWGITGQKPKLVGQITAELVRIDGCESTASDGFTKLEDFLAAESWREADQQTKALILETNSGNKLGVKEIRSLPCELIHRIDNLWFDYSKGCFGFSTQQQVWESLFKKTFLQRILQKQQNLDPSDAFTAFGERVGWLSNTQWIQYSNLTFSAKAPMGCFPYSRAWLSAGWGKSASQFSELMLRLKNCNQS